MPEPILTRSEFPRKWFHSAQIHIILHARLVNIVSYYQLISGLNE